MGTSLKNLLLFVIGITLFLILITFALSMVWREGGFQLIFQFIVSTGFMVCAFYFFVLSKGNVGKRILSGLVFLVLSPVSYYLCNSVFFDGTFPSINLPGSPRYPSRGGSEALSFLMSARIGHDIPIFLLALLGLLLGNGIFISRRVGRQGIIGGNVLLLGWIVLMYWMAHSRGY